MPALVSVAALVDDEWIVRSDDHPAVVTRGSWLEDVIARHRAAVVAAAGRHVDIRFVVGDRDTCERIAHVQETTAHARQLRAEARELEAAVSADREELQDVLAGLYVAPSEIATILGLSVRNVRDELGSDEEALIARRIMQRLHRT
jgi:hypothetical protein